MSSLGLLVFRFIPIILGTLILAYTDWKLVGIISIVFGLCCLVYTISQPCIGCYGQDTERYRRALGNARRMTMIMFAIGIGFSLLIWNFVGTRAT